MSSPGRSNALLCHYRIYGSESHKGIVCLPCPAPMETPGVRDYRGLECHCLAVRYALVYGPSCRFCVGVSVWVRVSNVQGCSHFINRTMIGRFSCCLTCPAAAVKSVVRSNAATLFSCYRHLSRILVVRVTRYFSMTCLLRCSERSELARPTFADRQIFVLINDVACHVCVNAIQRFEEQRLLYISNAISSMDG